MAEFINTIDVLGDEAVADSIIERSITEFNDNSIQFVGEYAFRYCSKLVSANIPAATSIEWGAFQNCSKLAKLDFALVESITGNAFAYSELATLILRRNAVCTLLYTGAFTNTPISKGTGYIYIPAALKEQYAQSTNWSVYAAQFRALEDYTVDGTIWGDLDEAKIAA